MLEKISDPGHVRLVEGNIPIRHRYTPGVAGTAFFKALKEGQLLGSRCDTCGVTYCPSRLFCERCFSELAADSKVGPAGRLESFTVCYVDVEGRPLAEPVAVGLVRLDGADTVLMHYLVGDDPPEIGQRVEALFQPVAKRSGSILDIRGFKPSSR